MAVLKQDFSASHAGRLLIAGAANRRIQVLRVLFSPTTTGQMRLEAYLDAGTQEPLFGWLRGNAGACTELVLGKEYAVTTAAGQGLSMSAEVGDGPINYSVTVWYELVP